MIKEKDLKMIVDCIYKCGEGDGGIKCDYCEGGWSYEFCQSVWEKSMKEFEDLGIEIVREKEEIG